MNSGSIIDRAWRGEVFDDFPIIDMHCHLGRFYQFSIAACEIDDMIAVADRIGVDQLCVAPHAALSCDYRFGNTLTKQAIQRHPDRVLGYLTLNANFAEEYEAELALYGGMEQFIGVKLHPSLHEAGINSPGSLRVFELLTRLGGFALVHTWAGCPYCAPRLCEEVLQQYPAVPFIFAHAAGTHVGVPQVVELVNRYENAYLDTSGFEYSMTSLEELVAETNPEKILYGSDVPYHDMRPVFARVAFAKVEDQLKRRIFAENFLALREKNPKKSWE